MEAGATRVLGRSEVTVVNQSDKLWVPWQQKPQYAAFDKFFIPLLNICVALVNN